jgi:PleD family two-component response regulator
VGQRSSGLRVKSCNHIMVLDCDLPGAQAQVERMQKWVFGEYTIPIGTSTVKVKIHLDASVGVAQWRPGETTSQVIERADASMYKQKELSQR